MARRLRPGFVKHVEAEMQEGRREDLRAAIKATGMTKSAFARALGVDVRTVRRWLEGRPIDPPTGMLFYLLAHETKQTVYLLDFGLTAE